jgi:sec-independent protein translocase protein TatB
MFNIFSWQHILILAVIALVVVGPQDLPRFMRMAANWVTKGRSMASSFRRNFEDMTRTTDLDGLRAELNALKRKHPLSSMEASASAPVVNDRPSRG